jgi:HTH-type transcriptional regulator/antitoxin HigA
MLRVIKNSKEHQAYLVRAYELMQLDLKPDSPESDELELLSMLIEDYEKKAYPVNSPNPIEAIKFRMDQLGLKPSELQNILGSRSRASEIMSGKRKLSLGMIRKLKNGLGIPAEILIQDYDVKHG